MYNSILIEKRADPHIYKHIDGTYYFTATVPTYDRIILRSAKSLDGLVDADEVVIWEKHDKGEMSHYIWAPEIHYVDDGFCIYFAAKESESLDHTVKPHKIFVLRCNGRNPISDCWKEEGAIDTGWDSFSLDATTFECKGIRYFVWAQMKDIKQSNSNIYIAKMKDYKTIEKPAVCLTKPELDWECNGFKVNEGPALVEIRDTVYLTYSASATDYNYCVGLLTADADSDLLDAKSWIKQQKPILKTDEELEVFGPGHNSFTVSEDDSEILFVYHARDYKNIEGDPLYDHNRHTRIRVFDFYK